MVLNKVLVVVDMQNDFIDGSLGSNEAREIVPRVVEKIRNWDGNQIVLTMDTHGENYLQTVEGKHLPVRHCIAGTGGHSLHPEVTKALIEKIADGCVVKTVNKYTFGSAQIVLEIKDDPEYVELVGLCTDICVISNALLLKAAYFNIPIAVDSSCCAGTSVEMHNKALDIMKQCHIEVF